MRKIKNKSKCCGTETYKAPKVYSVKFPLQKEEEIDICQKCGRKCKKS